MLATRLVTAAAGAAGTGVGRDEIYVATTPLRASSGPARLLFSAAHSLRVWDLQHFMLIVNPSAASSSPPPSESEPVVFDFQPEDPENILTALAALAGRSVPGIILERKIMKLPRKNCWLVGSSKTNALQDAHKFNISWETDLRIGQHDCRDYVNGLVEHLTGEKCILEKLKREESPQMKS